MHRRTFMQAAVAATAANAAAQPPKPQYFQLQYFYLRNGTQPQRVSDFFQHTYAPALSKQGLPPFGFFQPVIGEASPYWLVLLSLPTLDAIETIPARLAQDNTYQKASEKFLAGDPPYVRRDITLLRAFNSMPAVIVPSAKENSSRIFEIRTYESNTSATLKRKVAMFESGGEIGIFQRLGMSPVFFGQTIVGRNMPSLTYMLAYDDLAARDRVWKAFGSDPEWQKLRALPGNSDAEIVSNISNLIVRPAAFSQVK
jgi:hypothetical protein